MARRSRARSVSDRDGDGDDEPPAPIGAPASERAVLRRRDFGSCTPEELARLRRLMSRMKVVTPQRPSRRRRRHPRGDAIDLRASIRRARRTGGDPATLVRRRVTERRRRVVLMADVSGSMEAYSRAYLYLLHGAVRALRAETFVFSTRLTRVTRTLAVHDPERALATAMAATDDWSGGTRIGSALKEFNDRWGRRGLARGAVVVIVSDGWESGDTTELGRQMDRLSRLAHRIVWVNPRSQSPDYQPLVGGMAAALPYVDAFVSGHSLEALEHVLDVIATGVSSTRRATRSAASIGADERPLIDDVVVELAARGCTEQHARPTRMLVSTATNVNVSNESSGSIGCRYPPIVKPRPTTAITAAQSLHPVRAVVDVSRHRRQQARASMLRRARPRARPA